MLKLTKILGLIVGSFLSCALCISCSSEEVSPVPEIPEGMTQVSFLLPQHKGNSDWNGTRAFNESEEGYMSNLYVVAIKYVDFVYNDDGTSYTETNLYTDTEDNRKVYTYALNPVGVKFDVGSESYKLFNVTLYPGKYKFGVIANVDLYLSRQKQVSDFTKEEDFQNIVLNFSEDTPLAPLHLPMVCLPQNVQWKDIDRAKQKGEGDNYLIPIKQKKDTQIYADMSFLCSKVRYTILFDKTPTGISKAFGSSWIRFNVDDQNKPWVSWLRKQTKLEPGIGSDELLDSEHPYIPHTTDGSTEGRWNMSIDRFYWPGQDLNDSSVSHGLEGGDYPLSPNSMLEPYTGLTSEWIPMEQKVWQGVVYLPENKDGENKTTLHFPYHTRINDQDDTPEVEAKDPKTITLFSVNDQKYEGLDDDKHYNSSTTGSFTGLDRNYFYDVVAKVVNPDVEEMDIRVFVSILPWHEVDQDLNSDSDFQHQPAPGPSSTQNGDE